MSDITQIRITWKLDATVSVKADGEENWIKPGVEASASFSGLPTKEQLNLVSKHLVKNIIEPQISEIVDIAIQQIDNSTAEIIKITSTGRA